MYVIGDPRKTAARMPQTAENEVFAKYLRKYLAYDDAISQTTVSWQMCIRTNRAQNTYAFALDVRPDIT